jgi:class 3 adenylate cyclase
VTGRRGAGRVDRVLATVLFTDIVSSTERATALGDRAWHDVLDRHDAMAQRIVGRHGGRVVKATGDGLLATFDGPARGIRCATELVHAAEQLDLSVRAGAHTGEVEVRGDDVAGIAVHIGSRVAGRAGGGEVLVSRTVKDLVAGSGLAFEDRGEHELKGVPDRWQLFRVVG